MVEWFLVGIFVARVALAWWRLGQLCGRAILDRGC
jgi:hypothetical protein